MGGKRSREELSDLREHVKKIAVAKAAPGIVSIVAHNVPVEMYENLREYSEMVPSPPEEIVFFASGMIIECNSSPNGEYLCTVLAPASLFMRTNSVQPHDIEIDVFGSSGVLFKGKLLTCDFHYNLAAITIKSDSPLHTVTIKGIDDVLSIDPTDQLHLRRGNTFQLNLQRGNTFQLRPQSNLFKIAPGTELISISRDHTYPYALDSGFGTFCSSSPKGSSCNELYEIKDNTCADYDGRPVINSFGEIIGIIFSTSFLLPSNIVLRWWSHYKTSGGLRRPLVGMEVANLHDADLDFLTQFMIRFPNVSTAVVVTKVNEDSPAYCSGIRTNDVIVKLDGELVQSKLEFYKTIWEKAGKVVGFNVFRVTDGEKLYVSMAIEEASPNKFHQWAHPGWTWLCGKPQCIENFIRA